MSANGKDREGADRRTMSGGSSDKHVEERKAISVQPLSKSAHSARGETVISSKELEGKLKRSYEGITVEKAAETFIIHSLNQTKSGKAPPFFASEDELRSMTECVDPAIIEKLIKRPKDGKILKTSDGKTITIDDLLGIRKQDSNTTDLKKKLGDRKEELEEKDKDLKAKDKELKENNDKLKQAEKELDVMKDKYKEICEKLKVKENVAESLNKKVDELLEEKTELKKQMEELENENKHHCEKNDSDRRKFEAEVKQLSLTIVEKNEIIARLEMQLEEANQETTKMYNKLDKYEKKCQNLDGQLKRERRTIECMKEDHEDEIRKIHNQTKDLVAERDDLRNRFSKLAGAKLTDQNPDIADLSDPNRAMKLSDKFGELYDDQWTDAFESLQSKKKTAREAIEILLNVLKKCEDFFKKLREGQMDSLKNVLLHPSQDISTFGTDARKHVGGLKEHERLTSADKKAMRELRRQVGVSEGVLEEVKQVFLLETKKWEEKKLLESCTPYLQRCAELCWLIVTHDPPLYIKFDVKHGDHMDLNLYNRYSSKGSTIDYLVWPALFNEKDGGLLSKGTAEPIRTVKKD